MAKPGSRYLSPQVERDLRRKMVLVAGPRQVGKTTLARALRGADQAYLNWDVAEDRRRILRGEMPPGKLWILDEIHKHRGWRNLLKGLWDGRRPSQRLLVTGSARLDFYRFGGDSLQGRYHLLRLHPLSAAELSLSSPKDFEALLRLGGFPEPFFGGSAAQARRWSRDYRDRLVREEIRDLERVEDLGHIELLALRLPELVGSPLSINGLREDLQVSHRAVSHWLEILERLYGIFRLAPFGAPPRALPMIRSVKKERKHYHFDWSVVPDEGARFENLIASHLLKWVHFIQDTEGRDIELRYFRDTDGREVDFVIVEGRRPLFLVEAKLSETEIHKNLRYLHQKFPEAEAFQVHGRGTKDYVTPDGIRVSPALAFLTRFI
jgi:hypothetical protein